MTRFDGVGSTLDYVESGHRMLGRGDPYWEHYCSVNINGTWALVPAVDPPPTDANTLAFWGWYCNQGWFRTPGGCTHAFPYAPHRNCHYAIARDYSLHVRWTLVGRVATLELEPLGLWGSDDMSFTDRRMRPTVTMCVRAACVFGPADVASPRVCSIELTRHGKITFYYYPNCWWPTSAHGFKPVTINYTRRDVYP